MKGIAPKMAAFLVGLLIISFSLPSSALNTVSIIHQDTLRLIGIDMPRREIIETLGTPDVIKSEGMALQYTQMGLSLYLNQKDQVEQIYLAREFKGFIGKKDKTRGIGLEDLERAFGSCAGSVDKLNYQPSPIIRTGATTETENKTDPTGREKGEFPLQYPGERKLYAFYNEGEIMKYKYVHDSEGVAFWMDHEKRLYAAVIYTPRAKEEVKAPALARAAEKAPVTPPPLSLIHFDFDRHEIKRIYVPVLEGYAAFLSDNPSASASVHGHTDYFGSIQYNQKLSWRRAEAVRAYLVEKGIAPDRIKIAGHGELKPLTDDKTAEGRALNRRAEIGAAANK